MGGKSGTTSDRHREILDALVAGVEAEIKPGATHHLAMTGLDEWRYGFAAVTWEIDERFRNYDGSLFGGYISALADRIISLATFTVLEEAGERFRTTDLRTQFWRPVFGKTLRAEARVANRSRRLIHVDAEFLTEDGKIAARAQGVNILTRGEAVKAEAKGG